MANSYGDFDIRTVDRDSLKQISTVHIDESLPCESRMASFMEQIGNRYCYADDDMVIAFAYADTDMTLTNKLAVYASSLG